MFLRSLRFKRVLVGGSIIASSSFLFSKPKAKACGIVAYVGEQKASPFLMHGLQILKNRGYDSAGISTVSSDKAIMTTKIASKDTSDAIVELGKQMESHKENNVGIGHSRWATHGPKTDENSHPHMDAKNRIAVVHNGTINNFASLKKDLEAKGITFRSETDTEVIAQYIGYHLDQDKKLSLLEAVKKTVSLLEGTYGICVISKDEPDKIIACQKGSPLVIGFAEQSLFVASEKTAFSAFTNDFLSMKDGEIATITKDGTDINSYDLRMEKSRPEKIHLKPDPYPNFTIKEIMEQPEAISRTLNYGGRFVETGVKLGGLEQEKLKLLGIQNLTIAACGTSLFAGLYGAKLFRHLQCFNTTGTMDAAEFTSDSLAKEKAGLLVISQSGETKDTHRSVTLANQQQVPTFSIVNQVGSLIARSTKCGVYLNAGRENAVASTKAFTTQVTALALTSLWFAEKRGSKEVEAKRLALLDSVHKLPINAGITLNLHEQCKTLAAKIIGQKDIFILGKGFSEPIAHESALKLKEMAYVHSEGYSSGALKHGPFALISKGTPIIHLIMDDEHAELSKLAAHETKTRGSFNIVITDKPELAKGIADETLIIPSNGPLTSLLAVIPVQMLAYEMSQLKQISVDCPRNLAKTVTVD